jgi:hypothetical protein
VLRRLTPTAAALLLSFGVLTGCGGDGGNNNDSDDGSPSPGSETSEGEESYLPVPDGVELTEPGSELGVGESGVIAWQPRQDFVGVLDITITRLEKTSFAESFEGWDVKAEQKKDVTPYFVHATVTNVGDTNLSERLVPLYASDTADTLVEPTKFTEEFKPCPGGSLPRGYVSDETAKVCMVYLIGNGLELGGVTFRPTEDFEAITWRGEIQAIEKPKDNKKNDKGGDRDNG